MFSKSIVRLVGTLCMLSSLTTPLMAQNTTSGASYGYVVGQGPINVFFGNTAGTDFERWYTVGLIQGKSYCFTTSRGNSEYNIDVDLTIDLIQIASGAVLASFDGVSGDPAVGDNSRWTRGCLVAAATQSYYVRLHKCVCATGRTGNVQFEVIDTTIHSPWWFISNASGYDAFIELANTTTVAISAMVTVRSSAGAAVGSQSINIPAGGNMALSVTTLTGGAPAGSGSVQAAHNGPAGALMGNVTTLSAVTGLSFDSPFVSRSAAK